MSDPTKIFYEKPPMPTLCIGCKKKEEKQGYNYCEKYSNWCNLVYMKCHFDTIPKSIFRNYGETDEELRKRILAKESEQKLKDVSSWDSKPLIETPEITEEMRQTRTIPAITINWHWHSAPVYNIRKEDLKLKGIWNKIFKKRAQRKIDRIWDEMCAEVVEESEKEGTDN